MPDSLDAADTPTEGTNTSLGGNDILDLGLGSLAKSNSNYKQGSDFHLIFTLREDFLSYLERSTTDIPDLKNNRYCLQPINDEQAGEIIMRPRQGLVSKEVAKQIIAHVTGDDSFELDGVPEIQVDSAILSLYLSRLYEKMKAEGLSSITKELVEAYSDNIIEDFYSDAIRGLSPETVDWLEDTLVNEDGRRDNRDRGTVLREGHLTDGELKRLTDEVKLLRQFSYGGDLRIEFIHDVLCPVVEKRRNSRNEARRIAALSEAADREKRRARKTAIVISLTAVALAAITIGAYIWNQYQYEWEVSEAYYHYETRNGWPVGIGPKLTKADMARTPRYYILSHKGHSGTHHTSVRVGSSNECITEEPMATPFEIGAWGRQKIVLPAVSHLNETLDPEEMNATDSLLMKTHRIDFVANLDGDVDFMTFLDGNSEPLFSAKRYSSAEGDMYLFTRPDGSPQAITSGGADRVRLSTDSLGFVSSVLFYDGQGVEMSESVGNRKVFGYLKTVDPDSSSVAITALNRLKTPLFASGNTLQTDYGKDETREYCKTLQINSEGRTSLTTNFLSAIISPKTVKRYDYSGKEVSETSYYPDAKGNIIQAFVYGDGNDGLLYEYTYDDKGRKIKEAKMYSYDRDTISVMERSFNPKGEIVYYERRTPDGIEELYSKEEVRPGETRTIRGKDGTYVVVTDKIFAPGNTVRTYHDIEGNPINSIVKGQAAHKIETKTLKDGTTEMSFYSFSDGEVRPLDSDSTHFRIIEKKDDKGRLLNYRTFAADGSVLQSMMYFYRNGQLAGRAAMGVDATPVRCPDWEEENFAYYKMYFNTDNNGDYTMLVSVNEREVGSLLYWPEFENYITVEYSNLSGCAVDISSREFSFRSPLFPKVMINNDYSQFVALKESDSRISPRKVGYAHLLDKQNALYKAGLRDGDMLFKTKSLKGVRKVDAVRYTGDGYTTVRIDFGHPLTDEDLEHVHLHELNLSNNELNFFQNNYPEYL